MKYIIAITATAKMVVIDIRVFIGKKGMALLRPCLEI